MTTTSAVAPTGVLPSRLSACSEYVVLTAGYTVAVPLSAAAPVVPNTATPSASVMRTRRASATVHVSVTGWPNCTEPGVADSVAVVGTPTVSTCAS